MDNIENGFSAIGGRFITSPEKLKSKAKIVKAFIFDWDGVFNNGMKQGNDGSLFAEPDAMGLNMLKLNYFLSTGNLPNTFIITGQNNRMALKLATREHMNGVFLSYINKTEALGIICSKYDLKEEETAFIFDDILDLDVADKAGVSLLVNRSGSPLTTNHIISKNICDYVTGNTGGNNAVREVCELLIGLTGDMGKTIETRIRFTGEYERYLNERNKIKTKTYRFGEQE